MESVIFKIIGSLSYHKYVSELLFFNEDAPGKCLDLLLGGNLEQVKMKNKV